MLNPTFDTTTSMMLDKGTSIMKLAPQEEQPLDNFWPRYIESFSVNWCRCAEIWILLEQIIDAFDPTVYPCHLLWCLFHLKQYLTQGMMTCLCGASVRTVRKQCRQIRGYLSELSNHSVSFLKNCWLLCRCYYSLKKKNRMLLFLSPFYIDHMVG